MMNKLMIVKARELLSKSIGYRTKYVYTQVFTLFSKRSHSDSE